MNRTSVEDSGDDTSSPINGMYEDANITYNDFRDDHPQFSKPEECVANDNSKSDFPNDMDSVGIHGDRFSGAQAMSTTNQRDQVVPQHRTSKTDSELHKHVEQNSKSDHKRGNLTPSNLVTERNNIHEERQHSKSPLWNSNGVRYSGLLASNGGWALAEGNLRDSPGDFEKSAESTLMSKTGSSDFGPEVTNSKAEDEESSSLKFRNLSRSQKIILVATSITNLLSFLSLSILAPFFPIEADKKEVNGTIAGWIFGIFALVQFMSSPVIGRMLPIVGSKFMYIAGLFVACICTFLFGILDLVPHQDGIGVYVALCFAVRIVLALGCTAISNAGFVMLVKAFPDNVATVFGIGEIFTGIGMVTGPALGGFLYSAGGFVLPFIVIGGSCLIALPLIWYYLPPQDDSVTEEDDDLSIWKVLANPRSIVNSVVVIVAAAIWAILDPTLEPHLRVYGFGPEIVGVLFLIMAACYSVTSPLWGTLADKMPDNRVLLIPGFAVAAVGLLLLGPSPALGFSLSFNELWLTIVSLVILGVASSLVVIPTYDIYIEILGEVGYPENTRTYGMVSGIWVSMYALGDFIGPSVGGFLNDEVGFEWMATGVAGVCIATGVLVAVSWFIEAKCCKKKSYNEDREATERTHLLSLDRTLD